MLTQYRHDSCSRSAGPDLGSCALAPRRFHRPSPPFWRLYVDRRPEDFQRCSCLDDAHAVALWITARSSRNFRTRGNPELGRDGPTDSFRPSYAAKVFDFFDRPSSECIRTNRTARLSLGFFATHPDLRGRASVSSRSARTCPLGFRGMPTYLESRTPRTCTATSVQVLRVGAVDAVLVHSVLTTMWREPRAGGAAPAAGSIARAL